MKKTAIFAAVTSMLLLTSASLTVKADSVNNTSATNTSVKTEVRMHRTKYQPYADPSDMRKTSGNYWKYSSEKKSYPNLKKIKHLNIRVSILGNRAYIRSGKKVVYTMYASAGKVTRGRSLTPTGTYYTDNYHPHRFSEAFYPVGWIGQLYLFHSVPTYPWSKIFIKYDAHKLGKKPLSHGCIRLSVSDAKWLHDHVPYHTKVIIKYK